MTATAARPQLSRSGLRRRLLAASVLAFTGAAVAAPAIAFAHSPPPAIVSSHLATVEVLDRTTNTWLPVHQAAGERWIVGTPGHEYAIRVRNATGERILVVPSVDGVNAITGETATPDQSGYVLDPWGTVEIAGWRKSLSRTAAFYFTSIADSYAGRTGRPNDVGVIGVAVFRERRPVAWRGQRDRIADAADAAGHPAAQAPASPSPARAEAAGAMAKESLASAAPQEAKREDSRLGTGHGRSEHSQAQRVTFERATTSPEAVVAIRYDRHENLVARGILRSPHYASRQPSPFPAWSGFAPDPR